MGDLPAGPSRETAGYRIGCDVGGTFTDLICVTPAGEVVLDKTPTTIDDQSIGVMNGVRQLAERFGLSLDDFCRQIEIVVHGTTTADNTMIEMNGAPTGLLVTRGHRDEIEMRRVHKEEIWDPSYPAPIPIARRRVRIPIRSAAPTTAKCSCRSTKAKCAQHSSPEQYFPIHRRDHACSRSSTPRTSAARSS